MEAARKLTLVFRALQFYPQAFAFIGIQAIMMDEWGAAKSSSQEAKLEFMVGQVARDMYVVCPGLSEIFQEAGLVSRYLDL